MTLQIATDFSVLSSRTVMHSLPKWSMSCMYVCLVSHKYEHMQRKLDDLWEESKKTGLEINSSKTEEI